MHLCERHAISCAGTELWRQYEGPTAGSKAEYHLYIPIAGKDASL